MSNFSKATCASCKGIFHKTADVFTSAKGEGYLLCGICFKEENDAIGTLSDSQLAAFLAKYTISEKEI